MLQADVIKTTYNIKLHVSVSINQFSEQFYPMNYPWGTFSVKWNSNP